MSNGDLILLGVAIYAAIISLVRLLLRHRQTVLEELQRDVADEQRRKSGS